MNKLQITTNGVVVLELNQRHIRGTDDILSCDFPCDGGMKTIPWPLDKDNQPLPLELDLKEVFTCG